MKLFLTCIEEQWDLFKLLKYLYIRGIVLTEDGR